MQIKLFGQKLQAKGKGRHLGFLFGSVRADWRAVLVLALLAVLAGALYAEARLGAIRAAADKGELRRGGEDTLEVPEAAEIVRVLDGRGAAPAAAQSAASTTAATAPAV
jgi:hypothetical protein